ncbi:MAG: hypothetical protein EHM19_05005, partial [Candidatus Latescibacterota bacterium]
MSILDDLIATLDLDVPVKEIRQGLFHTAVVTRRCGLAATLPRDALKQEPPLVREAGYLSEKSARELVQMAHSPSIAEAAIGMAAINSLLSVDETLCRERNAASLLLEKASGKKVAVVGRFPFLPELREEADALWVVERNP